MRARPRRRGHRADRRRRRRSVSGATDEDGGRGRARCGGDGREELHTAIRDTPKPVIAKVRGYAIGGGNVLATLCDLTIAAETAIFGQIGPKMGSVAGRDRVTRARRRREEGARDVVPVPPLRRRRGARDGPRQQGRPRRRSTRTSEWCTELAERSPTAIALAKLRSMPTPRTSAASRAWLPGGRPLLPHRRIEGRRRGVEGQAQAELPEPVRTGQAIRARSPARHSPPSRAPTRVGSRVRRRVVPCSGRDSRECSDARGERGVREAAARRPGRPRRRAARSDRARARVS